jgi:hypothetical protein
MSESHIVCEMPSSTGIANLFYGTVPFRVTQNDQELCVSDTLFAYELHNNIEIDSCSPHMGPSTQAGTWVAVTGSNLSIQWF